MKRSEKHHSDENFWYSYAVFSCNKRSCGSRLTYSTASKKVSVKPLCMVHNHAIVLSNDGTAIEGEGQLISNATLDNPYRVICDSSSEFRRNLAEKSWSSIFDLEIDVKKFSKETGSSFWKSRTLKQRDSNGITTELGYSRITFHCVHGGRSYRSTSDQTITR